jgi:hypothetical protein
VISAESWVLIWFLLILVGLMILQRRLHFEIQACLLLITRREDLSLAIFSILFFPGVFLHEVSHYITARLLGVKAIRMSLLPEVTSGRRLRLGYVETVRTDFVRDSLIGLAPVASGALIISIILYRLLDSPARPGDLAITTLSEIFLRLSIATQEPDFWLWFYVIFVISSTMFPSASDRRAWLPLLAVAVLVVLAGLSLGIGPWLSANLLPAVVAFIRILTGVFAVITLTHLGLWFPAWILRRLLSGYVRIET